MCLVGSTKSLILCRVSKRLYREVMHFRHSLLFTIPPLCFFLFSTVCRNREIHSAFPAPLKSPFRELIFQVQNGSTPAGCRPFSAPMTARQVPRVARREVFLRTSVAAFPANYPTGRRLEGIVPADGRPLVVIHPFLSCPFGSCLLLNDSKEAPRATSSRQTT